MSLVLFSFLFMASSLFAQDLLKDLTLVHEQLSQKEVDKFLKKPSKEGLPGSYFSALLPAKTPEECNENGEPKKTHYEVILMSEVSTQKTKLEILPGQFAIFRTIDLQYLMTNVSETNASKGAASANVLARAADIWNSGMFSTPSLQFDPHSAMGKELFLESLVHASAKLQLSEKDLTAQMASVIAQTYKSDEEKFNILSALSLRLYRNYNTARNPGYDNMANNPSNFDLPPADMSMNDMIRGAALFNDFQGGVCNDISESVAQIGEILFPDKDVLVVNSGSHLGVVIADGKENRIIDGGTEMVMQNKLLLDPKMSPTNLRISKMQNGALREIAVVDTEMGQLTEAAFQTGKKLLKTDADISSLMAHYKKNNFGVTIGTGALSDSNVVIVVAKYETSNDKWKSYVGLGATAQHFSQAQPMKYQVHFRAGLERNMFRYVNSNTEINFATGARMNGMYALNQNRTSNVNAVDLSLGLDLTNRLDARWGMQNPNGIQLKSSLEVEHTLGPSNWGNNSGALSKMEWNDIPKVLKNTTFHLNQINAQVTAEKKLSPMVSGFVNTHHQGSNIGQSVSGLAGVNIRAPAGAQILIFTGYTKNDIAGFETKHSLLAAPSGLQLGGKYVSKKGIEIGGAVRGISGKPSVGIKVKVPFGNSGR